MNNQDADEDHYFLVADRLLSGRVVPFLGAGANLCGRPEGVPWALGEFLPSGRELAERLARRSRYPLDGDLDLLRVAQYVDAVLGEQALYEYLRATFDADYPPTTLHLLLADVAAQMRDLGRPPLLILTTNYDDALERAFKKRDVPCEVLWYEAKRGDARGRFRHRREDKAIPRPTATSSPRTTTSTTSRPATSPSRSRSRCSRRWARATSCSSATRCATGTCGSSSTGSGASRRST